MNYFWPILWLVLIVGFAILEGITEGLWFIWFCIGAAAGLLMTLFGFPPTVQIAVAVIVSIMVLAALRPYAKRRLATQFTPTNADRNVGRQGHVLVSIVPGALGRVRLEGVDWNAKSEEALETGTPCIVCAVEGTTLIVKAL